MTTLYDNFFFNPADTFGITASYTIPEGKYARIYPNSPYALVDGNEIFLGLGYSKIMNNSYLTIGLFSGKISSSAASTNKGIYKTFRSSSNVISREELLFISSGTSIINFYAHRGSITKVLSGSVGASTLVNVAQNSDLVIHNGTQNTTWTMKPFVPHHVFVKEGTVLLGDFTVELFNNPLGV